MELTSFMEKDIVWGYRHLLQFQQIFTWYQLLKADIFPLSSGNEAWYTILFFTQLEF